MEYFFIELALLAITGFFVVLWWLLRQKDRTQEKQIEGLESQTKLLFTKHDEDAQRLADLELKIASNHYIKPELDAKFDRLERSIREGMHELGGKFDRLSEALIQERHQK